MPKVLFREVDGPQTAGEGQDTFGVVDLIARAIRINTLMTTRHIGAAYSYVAKDAGNFFVADAALTFTLPAAATFKGHHCWLVNGADTTLTLAGTAGELVTFNDVAANSLALQTSSEKIGGGWHCVCDGTKWYCLPMTEETQTITVTT